MNSIYQSLLRSSCSIPYAGSVVCPHLETKVTSTAPDPSHRDGHVLGVHLGVRGNLPFADIVIDRFMCGADELKADHAVSAIIPGRDIR